ncbi:MAG: circadian clock protein KaiC [Pseudomonadota bacterium]
MITKKISHQIKSKTGIQGLDEITGGGLPAGLITLAYGNPGSGKTILGIEYLVYGATAQQEPGLLVTFEENSNELSQNFASLGIDLTKLIADNSLAIEHIDLDDEFTESGDFTLDGLQIRISHLVKKNNVKRIVIDGIEALLSRFNAEAIIRNELRKLMRWLRKLGVTTLFTGEISDSGTKHGFEAYLADCVLMLDHRVIDQLATRRLRVIKYRGSSHGQNEYPFIISENGLCILPITSLLLEHQVFTTRVPTGLGFLDKSMQGGYYKGSSVLVSGSPGSGKSTLAAHFTDATCRDGKRCLYLAFEEAPNQIIRNMQSIGILLDDHINSGKLLIHSTRPTRQGLEAHLIEIQTLLDQFKPDCIVVDPVTNFITAGSAIDVRLMFIRMVDLFKNAGVTSMFVALHSIHDHKSESIHSVSSLMDTWITVNNDIVAGKAQRALLVIKSRGTAHNNESVAFNITNNGIELNNHPGSIN